MHISNITFFNWPQVSQTHQNLVTQSSLYQLRAKSSNVMRQQDLDTEKRLTWGRSKKRVTQSKLPQSDPLFHGPFMPTISGLFVTPSLFRLGSFSFSISVILPKCHRARRA